MSTMGDEAPGAAIDNLYPALTQCFAIIMCGYLAARMNLVSETEAKGINTFVGTFALPSLIFTSLAELQLNSVNWIFLLAVLISKSIVFASVVIITLLVGRPVNLARSGIFAIFCTQSNDFAIGYPIVAALYQNTHPEYANYLYLMAPISLAILNPISFILMEIGKQRRNDMELFVNEIPHQQRLQLKMILGVIKNIFLNPTILMTILGIVGNFAFNHQLPIYLSKILESLGAAFSASALFLLGLRMVGKVHKLRGATLIIPGIIIMVKLIVLPLVTREVISVLKPGFNDSETDDLSTYGFLYGTFPSAPTVFVFSTQYNIDVDLIASAMVACTFISAPLMFVSAKMITLTSLNPSDYIKQLCSFTFDISIVGFIACVWVLIVLHLTKKILRIPHKITACLVISQMISCLGAIFWHTFTDKQGWVGDLQFSLFTIGVYSARLWTTILAITLLFLQCRSLCYVLKLQPVFVIVGWGLPILMSTALLIFNNRDNISNDSRNPNFVYGIPEAIASLSLLVLCFILTVGCLILHQRYRRRFSRYLDLTNDVSEPIEPTQTTSTTSCCEGTCGSNKYGKLPTINEGCSEETPQTPVVDIEDLLAPQRDDDDDDGLVPANLCPSGFGCEGPARTQCQGIVRQYQEQIDPDLELIEEEPESHDPQILRHTVLLILLLCSMFVGLALSIWTLVMDKMSGIYIELSFLDATLNFGQSLMVFAIFGLDTKEVALPLLRCWRKIWFGANTLNLPAWHELSPETRHICDQFVTHHLRHCNSSIAEDKRWRIKIYKDCFSGQKFVDWLIEVGLARDRTEAVNYARHLIEGKVLRHINCVYHFYDRHLLYTFC